MPSSGNTKTDSGRDPGTRYQYAVVATAADGEFRASTYGWTLPATPTGLRGARETATPRRIVLSWSEVSHADSYEIRERPKPGSYGGALGVGAGTSHVQTVASDTTEYCYQIRSVQGTRRSEWLEVEKCVRPPDLRPDPPDNFRVTAITASSITLRWDSVNSANSYAIHRVAPTETPIFASATNVGNVTAHTVDNLEADTEYRFGIWSVAGDLGSESLSETTGRTERRVCTPVRPSNFRATALREAIKLTWDEPEGTTCVLTYRIDRREGSSGDYSTLESGWAGTEFTHSGLNCRETYYYRIYTMADGTTSPNYRSVNAIPRCIPPVSCDITGATIQVDDKSQTWVDLSWSHSDNGQCNPRCVYDVTGTGTCRCRGRRTRSVRVTQPDRRAALPQLHA